MIRAAVVLLALAAGPPVCVDDCTGAPPCASVVCGVDASVDMIQWSDGRTLCDVARASERATRDGRVVRVAPRAWYEPHPGDLGCWRPGEPTTVRVRFCRRGDCSPWSDPITIPALPEWRCFRGDREVPCEVPR